MRLKVRALKLNPLIQRADKDKSNLIWCEAECWSMLYLSLHCRNQLCCCSAGAPAAGWSWYKGWGSPAVSPASHGGQRRAAAGADSGLWYIETLRPSTLGQSGGAAGEQWHKPTHRHEDRREHTQTNVCRKEICLYLFIKYAHRRSNIICAAVCPNWYDGIYDSQC